MKGMIDVNSTILALPRLILKANHFKLIIPPFERADFCVLQSFAKLWKFE